MKFTLKKTLKATMLITTAILGLSSTALADALDDGMEFYQQGNYQAAARMFKDAAELGNVNAQFYLGLMYYEGVGVAKDLRQAVKWIEKAAEGGEAEAQTNLGNFYYYGQGVKKNIKTAKKWFEKACNNGAQKACDNLRMLQ